METSLGGPKQNITGTIQDVVAQLSIINPNWEEEFNFTTSQIDKRALSFPFTGIQCNIRIGEWDYASTPMIDIGISYLNGVSGIPTNGPGPGNCGRVSCSGDAAIYWCNDVCLEIMAYQSLASSTKTLTYSKGDADFFPPKLCYYRCRSRNNCRKLRRPHL